jgi:hypothetical protein
MGIGDFGVTATGTGYTYATSRFLATAQIRSWTTSGSGGSAASMQLNVVVVLTNHGTTMAYWIQDVPFYDTSTGYFDVENNIWNMSKSGATLSAGVLSGNGSIYSSGSGNFYAADAGGSYNGSNVYLSLPVNISAEVVTSTISGLTHVAFLYDDGYGWQTYDNVTFPWSTGWADRGFVVNGTSYNGMGLFDDAEWIVGGPGGGSSTQTQKAALTYGLEYWNGHNFKAVPYAYDFGSDTAELVSYIQEALTSGTPPGAPGAVLTAGSGGLHRLYNLTGMGVLNVTPNTTNGTLLVHGTPTTFLGHDVNLTLQPGTYRVAQLNGTQTDATASVTLTAGHYAHVSMPTVSVSPGTGTAGQTVNVTGRFFAPDIGFSVTLPPSAHPVCNGTTSSSGGFNCTGTLPGVAAGLHELTGTDASSYSESGMTPFLVTTNLRIEANASPLHTDVGLPIAFTANTTGGSTPYVAYNWSFGDGSNISTTVPTTTHRYSGSGSYVVVVEVTDSVGSAINTSVTVHVSALPIVSSLGASATSADVGQTVVFTAGASLGTPPYLAYHWSGLASGCTPSNTSRMNCTFVASGELRVEVTVTDSLGGSSAVGAILPYTVFADPAVTTPVASPPSVDLGQTVRFEATASSGSGSPQFTWAGLPSGCSGYTPIVGCTPGEAGTFHVAVSVTDSNGRTANATAALTFTVYPVPKLPSAPTVSSASVDVGEPLRISATASGGSGNFTYAWGGLPAGCRSGNGSSVNCTPTLAGVYLINVTATDSNQVSARLSFAYEVVPALQIAGPSAPTNVTDVGRAIALSALGVGGAGGYRYRWSGLPAGCAGTGAALECVPSAAGDFLVNASVTDDNGATVWGSALRIIVNAAPTVTSVDVSPPGLIVGDQLTLQASTAGGTPAYSYWWSGLPAGCLTVNATVLKCYPSASGSSSVTFHVLDAAGGSTNDTVEVDVGSAFLGLPAIEGYAIVAGIGALAVVGAVLAFRRPRQPSKTPAAKTPAP